MAIQLISAATGNTTSEPVFLGSNGIKRPSTFTITYFAYADSWASGTAKLQISPNNAVWFDVADTSVSADSAVSLQLGGGVYVRAVFTGTSATNVNVYISD